jgi:hypothetical protein
MWLRFSQAVDVDRRVPRISGCRRFCVLWQPIDAMMPGRAAAPTTFVIAHRFSTILSADTIVVMEAGQIVGQGKHDDLLRTCPTYKQLYERLLFAA